MRLLSHTQPFPLCATRLLAPLSLALLACALAPAIASAATVTDEGGQLVLRAAPGEDSLRVEGDGSNAVQLAAASFTSYPGDCVPAQWTANAIDCPLRGGGVKVFAGDGADTVNVYSGLPGSQLVEVDGGDGEDELSAYSHGGTTRLIGGPGNDELAGSPQSDVLLGGAGDDVLEAQEGTDEVRGEDGADTLRGDADGIAYADVIDGGPGADSIERDWYTGVSNQPHVGVSLDGQANDGRPGEGDNVASVERIHLTYAATLAAAGEAVDFEVFNSGNGGSRLVGSPAADRLRSYDDRDAIEAGAGDDWIEAGYGDDTIDPGPGRDQVNAEAGSGSCNFLVCRVGTGNDTINARDGEADSIQCGVGTDVARVDAVDTVTDCETVEVGGGSQGDDGPGTNDDGGSCTVPKVKRGTKSAKAVKAVKAAGCKAKVVKARSRTVKKGRVIKLSPKAGRKLARGAKVKVYVSRGR
jgi:Ca2+-binding RTX toxin-like protein